MFLALAILLIVWFADIPLWVSICCTVLAGTTVLIKFFNGILSDLKRFITPNNEDNDNDI